MTVDQHRHDDDGNVILLEQESPQDAEIKAMAQAAEAQAEAQVEIARVQADAEVAIAKLETKSVDEELAVQLAAALAELEALKAAQAPAEPEPVQAVVVDASEPEVDESELPPADHSEHSERPHKRKVGLGMW